MKFRPVKSTIHRKKEGNFKNYLRFQNIYLYICTVLKKEQYIARILEAAGMLFRKRGFKSVSMDDLARETGMSKKTIYKFYDSKAKLIEALVFSHIERKSQKIAAIEESVKNPVQAMVEIGHLVFTHYKEMSADVLVELKKYYYNIWLEVDKMQRLEMLEEISNNIRKGVELGLYRSNINSEFITFVYVNSVITACDQEDTTLGKEVYYLMLLEYHMYGVMTEKGRKLFDKYKAKFSD